MTTSTYKLTHTAEDIDYKLSLLEYGKNLLPYPYYAGGNESDASISSHGALTDYGDGSILVHGAISAGTTQVLLDDTCVLAPGTYTISTNVEDSCFYLKAEVTTESSDTESGECIEYDNITAGYTFLLEKQAHVKTFLVINTETDINVELLTIKPQIERNDKATDWKPYMSTVNNYIDNRFNGIKTKLSTHYYTQKQIDQTVSTLQGQDAATLSAAKEYTDTATMGLPTTDMVTEQVKNIVLGQLTLGYGEDDKVYIFLDGEQIGTGIDVSILL